MTLRALSGNATGLWQGSQERRRTRRLVLSALVAGSVLGSLGATAGPAAAQQEHTYRVTTTADVVDQLDGELSLREAVDLSNADGAPSRIELRGGLTYVLSRCSPGREDGNVEGDLDLSSPEPVTIRSNSEAPASIRTTCPDERFLHVTGGAQLRLLRLDLRGASQVVPAWGRGFPPPSEWPIEAGGGAVLSDGMVVVEGSVLAGNRVTTDEPLGGDVNAPRPRINGGAYGGAIASSGIRLIGSRVEGNHADWGGGIASWLPGLDGSLPAPDGDIRGSEVIGNTAFSGGGIYGAQLRVDDSVVAANQALRPDDYQAGHGPSAAGGVYAVRSVHLENARLELNASPHGAAGHVYSWELTARNTRFIGGEAAGAGAAVYGRDMRIERSHLFSNSGQTIISSIGSAYSFQIPGRVEIDGTVIERNTAEWAHLYHLFSDLRVTSSLVRSNTGADAVVSSTPTTRVPGPFGSGLLIERSQFEFNSTSRAVVQSLLANQFATGPSPLTAIHNTTFRGNEAVDGAVPTWATLSVAPHPVFGSDQQPPTSGSLLGLDHVTVDQHAGRVTSVFDWGSWHNRPLVRGVVLQTGGGDACHGLAPRLVVHSLVSDASCLGGSGTGTGTGNVIGSAFLGPERSFSVQGSSTTARAVGSAWADWIPLPACVTAVDQRGVQRPQGTGCSPGAIEEAACVTRPCDEPEVGRRPDIG